MSEAGRRGGFNAWLDALRCAFAGGRDHPVCAAAALSFGFVFIHPFIDGNGRIHRFLIHHELARTGFAPERLIFPVSAVMLRGRRRYEEVLENFSRGILPFIEYEFNAQDELQVLNRTAEFYRYWDATLCAEFLYSCLAETLRSDLREELGFLECFDRILRAVSEVVDLPKRRASLLVRLLLQNGGRLAKSRRECEFGDLPDEEIENIERVAVEVLGNLSKLERAG